MYVSSPRKGSEADSRQLMHQYTNSPPNDPLKQARTDMDNVKDIMVQNIDSILQRGERLDTLVDKTDSLAGQVYAFRRGARNVRRQQWWKNTRITILSGIVGVVGLPNLGLASTSADRTVLALPSHRPILWC